MKRLLDLALLLVLMPLLIPLFVVTIVAVRLNLGSPIFFSQERGGYQGSRFRLWKFRSMTDDRDGRGILLPDHDRITRFGRILRSSSLDELPCVWNVAKGEMSFVGPRPFIADYLPLYTRHQMRRHEAKPGITGWAQVNGRNSLSWDEKFGLDIWYVENRSIWLDLKILVLTAKKVLIHEGINQDAEATMSRFTGSQRQKPRDLPFEPNEDEEHGVTGCP